MPPHAPHAPHILSHTHTLHLATGANGQHARMGRAPWLCKPNQHWSSTSCCPHHSHTVRPSPLSRMAVVPQRVHGAPEANLDPCSLLWQYVDPPPCSASTPLVANATRTHSSDLGDALFCWPCSQGHHATLPHRQRDSVTRLGQVSQPVLL